MVLSTHPQPLSPARPVARPAPSGRVLLVVAVIAGLVSTVLGAWLALHPSSVLVQDPETFLVRAVLGPAPTGVLLGVLGLVGVLGALTALPTATSRPPRSALLVVGAVQVAGFGFALQSVTTISLAGYLLAMALPVLVVALVLLTLVRNRRLGWPLLAVLAALVVWGGVSGALAPAALARLGRALAGGFATHAPQLGMTVLAATGLATWVLVVARLVRGTSGTERAGRWVLRHRRGLTLLAAAGPLPYALVRATWLTPWPLVAPGDDLPAETRLWGLLLGGAALVGTLLTLGLVARWGEVFPRWVPRVGGRPVPVPAAVVPGGLVAGIVSAAAVPMLRLVLSPDPGGLTGGLPLLQRLETALVFPFWLWGPALALAVWGYARHRAEG